MPETGATVTPYPLTDVDSEPLARTFAGVVRLGRGHLIEGMALTHTDLTAHIAAGSMIIMDTGLLSAWLVRFSANVDVGLVDDATNRIWLDINGDLTVLQSNATVDDAELLYTVPVAGGVVGVPTTTPNVSVDLLVALNAVGGDFGGEEITNVGPPTAPSSAARLQDVTDNMTTGMRGHLAPVRAATTANITLSGLQTVDGVVLSSQDRVLVKNQTDGSENGVYVALSSAWTRAEDFDDSDMAIPGMLVPVSEGTVNGNSIYGLDTNDPIVLDTDDLDWSRRDVGAHAALTSAHGSTSAATPSRIIERDAAGRAKVAAGAAADDIAIVSQITAGIGTAEAYAIQRANHTGTQTAATISDFDTQVRTSRLNQMAAPNAAVPMNSQRLTGVGTPTAVGDAVAWGKQRWNRVTTAASSLSPGAAVPNTFYELTSGAGFTGLLPSGGTLAVGDEVCFKDMTNTGSILVQPNTSQVVRFGPTVSGAGVAGYWGTNDNGGQFIRLRYAGSNVWVVVEATGTWYSNDAFDLMNALGGNWEVPAFGGLDVYGSANMHTNRITSLGAPVATSDAARLDTVSARAPAYADVSVTALPAIGAILSQGILTPRAVGPGSADHAALPGVAGFGHGTGSNAYYRVFALAPSSYDSAAAGGIGPSVTIRGTRYSVKGVIRARSNTRFDTSQELLAIGVYFPSNMSSVVGNDFAYISETSRDDVTTVAAVVGDVTAGGAGNVTAPFNVKTYNNVAGGSAVYTDSGVDVDPTHAAGLAFELIIETPLAADANNDLLITLKMGNGVLSTVLNAVTSVAAVSTNTAVPLLALNCDAMAYNLTYKVERIA